MDAILVAGGGAYYFAKKSINADRSARYEAEMRRKTQLAAEEAEHRRAQAASGASTTPSVPKETQKPSDSQSLQRAKNAFSGNVSRENVASPSTEAGQDPAPTRHEPETDKEILLEKSKYEAAETFRPPRGNRFS